ncbi:MAG: hypothetical protein KY432_02320 [Acidobacteria bacterium]|nr:hypothetical protein [Acidobacteriota bacterium]
MKRTTLPAVAIAALITMGCQEEPPEPEVSSPAANYEQPTTPPPYATTGDAAADQSQQPIDDVEKISLEELLELKEQDEVTIVDVRSAQYYVESHIPGSINIPAAQTSAMIDMIPKNRKIVTYCT